MLGWDLDHISSLCGVPYSGIGFKPPDFTWMWMPCARLSHQVWPKQWLYSNGRHSWVFKQKSTTRMDSFLCCRRLNLCFPHLNYFTSGTQVEKMVFSHCCGSCIHPCRCIKYSLCPRKKDMSEHVTIAHCFLLIFIWEKRRISLLHSFPIWNLNIWKKVLSFTRSLWLSPLVFSYYSPFLALT